MASEIMFGPLQFRATVGSMSSSAAYVSIMNHGKMADRLLDATSNLARKTELHLMEMDNGVMKMRPVEDGIDIPAGKTIHLAPGGYHVMLIGLNAPLKPIACSKSRWYFRMLARKPSKAWQCCHPI